MSYHFLIAYTGSLDQYMRRHRSWVTFDLCDLETRSLGRRTCKKDNYVYLCSITFLSDTQALQVNISYGKSQYLTSDLCDLGN